MEKQEKFLRKRSVDLKKLPAAPPLPDTRPKLTIHNENDPFYPLYTYKDRESLFLRSLSENIKSYHESETKDQSQSESDKNNNINCEDECYSYMTPLLNRANLSVSTALATKDSIDQLDKLHELMKQLLNIQEQNFRMRKSLKAVEALQYLKKMDIQIKSDPEKFLKSSIDENSDSELLEPDLEQKLADLEAVLLASRSASSKRNSSKRERSKSALSDEISTFRENDRNYPLRRQSAISDFKPKVSKWTKVKAAFKWEKANVLALNESKSTESILTPNNHELARYLRVPSNPCGVSSGESYISTSSGRILSGTSIGSGSALSPAELSSATSSGDENDDEKNPNKKKTRSSSYSQEDDGRRSRSLDGETALGQGASSHLDKNKGKSAWSKVKGIVKTHRTSAKSTSKSLSKSSGVSRDVSPSCDSTEMLDMPSEHSPGVSGSHHNVEMDVTISQSSAISSIVTSGISSDDNDSRSDGKSNKNLKINRGSRKSKHVPEIESLPEGIPLESKNNKPSPLIIQQRDFSESDGLDGSSPIHPSLRRLGNKSLTSSVPNSPSRINEFFSENDFSSGDFSEPVTPDKRLSIKSQSTTQKDEINKKYQELQKKLSMEFERKQVEWEKIRPLVIALNNTVPPYMRDDLSSPSTPKSPVPGLVREDNLSPHFKKKLNEWRQKKNQPPAKENIATKPTDAKKKNIPAKSEAQNLKLPDAKDLPEDFQKKLSEWKQMKAENRVPTYSQQLSQVSGGKRPSTKTDSPKIASSHLSAIRKSKTADELAKVEGLSKLRALVSEPVNKEIVVQTAEGLLKFEGISRKFTRKLYEWEKARGIGPESSTFALLHPGYKPVFAEHVELLQDNREKSPGIKRCLSVDSINPALPATPITHQPSSLSLNDVDELKENGNNIEEKSIDSNSEYFDDRCKIINRHDSHEQEEPEAVIVEVEDEGFEPPLTPLMTVVQKQIPVFKFDKTKKESDDHPHSDSNFELIKEVIEINENTICIVEIMCRNSDFSINQVKHLINVYKFLYQLLTKLVIPKDDSEGWKLTKTCMEYYYTTFRLLEEIEESNCGVNVDRKMQTVAKNVEFVKSILEQLRKHFDKLLPKNIPEINVTSVFGHQATQTVQNSDESQKSIATVIVTPTFLCNAVKIDDVQPCVHSSSSVHLEVAESSLVSTTPFSSESEIPYTTDNVVDESRKVTRNSSNGSKRRTRVRRLGSRQNSKTESDSEEDQVTVTLETPRKVKRKTSRCKKMSDTERPSEYQSHQVEDVVYVFKIKPGEKNEVACSASAMDAEENILISPTEACVELIEASNDAISPVQAVHQANVNNVIIKTKRKIFSPVDSSDANEGSMRAVVGQDIESSSASDKNENLDSQNPNSIENMPIVSNLPPIPQSPKVSRKDASKSALTKDVSPNIRLMIKKYNQNIDKKTTSPHSSGSCSPVAWRSPVLDRRVRRQTERYQEKMEQQRDGQKLSKSSSESKLTDELRENVFINQTDDLPMLKYSNGVDEATQTSEPNDNYQKFDDNIEEPVDKSSVETVVLKDDNHVEISMVSRGRRRSFENSEHFSIDSISIEKPLTVPSTPSTPVSAPSFTNIKEWLSADSTHEESPPIVVNMRYDESKPRTPLSERALKIKRAKEAFFNGTADGDFNWTYRMSQISVESADSFGQPESSMSKDSAELTTENAASSLERADADESGYASTCPPNISPARDMEPTPGSSKNSRFGLSSIATKLRKVKLKKSKDISKLNTVSQLCRQSLALDITNSSRCVDLSPNGNGNQSSPDQVPKSNSGQSLSRFKKTEKLDKIKKSKSLGGLDNNK